jgi:hypothetical protein
MNELYEFRYRVSDQIWFNPLRSMSKMFSIPIGTVVENSVKPSVYARIIDSVQVSFHEVNDCIKAKQKEYDHRRT